MSAILRASGTHFDVDHFCAESSLEACAVFRAGEPRLKSRSNGKRHTTSGINVVVSEAGFDAFSQQVAEAIAFLHSYRDQICKLCEFPGVEGAVLDFGMTRRDVAVQCDSFPPELIRLAGELGLGIELSQYPAEDANPSG